MNLYVSGYTKKDSKGIYHVHINNGKIVSIKLVAKCNNPTYLQIDEENGYLYANSSFNDGAGIISYKINNDYSVTKIDTSKNSNNNSCHLSIDKEYNRIYSVIYGDGIFESRDIIRNIGKITPVKHSFHQDGKGTHERQDGSHLHMVKVIDKYIYVCDLGLDSIYVLDRKTLSLIKTINIKKESGPRHMIFNENIAYVITELSNEVITLNYNNSTGNLAPIKYTKLLPPDYNSLSQSSAIRLNDKYLYTANRGYDHINVFKIEDNKLINIQNISTGGHWCRDFNISKCKNYLIAVHEKSYNLSIFSINNGMLKLIDNNKLIPEATCVCVID